MTANSICDSSQYDTLSTVIKTFHLEGPSGNLSLRSRIPDVQGQIGVPQLVDQILGSLNCCMNLHCVNIGINAYFHIYSHPERK